MSWDDIVPCQIVCRIRLKTTIADWPFESFLLPFAILFTDNLQDLGDWTKQRLIIVLGLTSQVIIYPWITYQYQLSHIWIPAAAAFYGIRWFSHRISLLYQWFSSFGQWSDNEENLVSVPPALFPRCNHRHFISVTKIQIESRKRSLSNRFMTMSLLTCRYIDLPSWRWRRWTTIVVF